MRYFLFACAALGLACGDTSPGPSDPSQALVGSWVLQSWELREVGNPANRLDMIADGFAGTLVVGQTRAFTLALTYQGAPTSSLDGTLVLRGDTLVFQSVDGESLFKYSTSGAAMTWVTLEAELIDVDQDDEPETVTEYIVFRRQ